MGRRDDRKVGPVRGGIAAAAKALGSAVGFFGRIRLPRRRGCAAQPVRKRRGTGREALESEIARLEIEIDQVYAQVVRGAGSVRRDEAGRGGSDLSQLLAISRDLKEQLRERRAELSRIERDETREKRLYKGAPLEFEGREPPESAVYQEPDEEPRTGRPLSDKMRRRISRAQRPVTFRDASQQIIFEKVVQDLVEDDPEIRRSAATRLGELESEQMPDLLTVVLEDPDDKVQAAALNSLALLGNPSSFAQFERFAGNSDYHLRLASLRGLSRVGDARSELILISALEDEQPAVRKAAATYLGWREARQATKALVSALHDEDNEVRAAAAAALGNIRDDRSVLSLIRLLLDSDRAVRQAAHGSLLALLGEELTVDIQADREVLEKHVQDLKDWWRQARVEKHIELEGGPPLAADARAAMPAMEPTAAAASPKAEEKEEKPAKVVKLRSTAPSRARKDKEEKPAKTAPAAQKKAEPEEEAEAAEGLDGMAELEGLGAVKASSAQESKEPPKGAKAEESIEDVLAGVESESGLEGEEEAEGEVEDDGEYESLLDGDLGVRAVETKDDEKK